MNGDTEPTEERPVEWSVWPPPQASRADRRACARRRHEGLIKLGYCVLCGTQAGQEADRGR